MFSFFSLFISILYKEGWNYYIFGIGRYDTMNYISCVTQLSKGCFIKNLVIKSNSCRKNVNIQLLTVIQYDKDSKEKKT